ncbi:MAG: hypothetical protein IPL63_14685 [Saprospiraceae bacterium]|nr:hypothetical protein [Saprospiraceae bacterium]
MLIDGFDSPPMIMMTYNFPYYVDLMEKNGLQKEMDLLAYYVTPQKVEKKSLALSDAINARLKKKGIVVRKISVHAIEKDAAMFEEISITHGKKTGDLCLLHMKNLCTSKMILSE